MRGFAAIGLDRPKCTANLGGVLRASQCYGASLVMLTGGRMGKYATDTMKAYRHLPCVEVDDLMAHVPYGAIPVVIEIVERARPLFNYVHPESAFYIFGPEDGGVRNEIVERCQHVVRIPTTGCMNLAATVNVVLYDRMSKRAQ
jgi:tRNA(Leu) C34 or U34 (ribose-2'-O)-methylase TrmL